MEPVPLFTRLWFAYVCFFAVLFDGVFAARVKALRAGAEPLPAAPSAPPPAAAPAPAPAPAPEREDPTPALQLLGLLQREGRLVDFLQQDVEGFGDADIAAAARVVHAGCRKALRAHVEIVPVRDEAEGARVTLEAGFDADAVKLTGNVAGAAPYRGTLQHRGWRARSCTLPRLVGAHDAQVLAPAEVEL